MRTPLLDRRAFLRGAGAAFMSGLAPKPAEAFQNASAVFATAYRAPNGMFGIATLTEQGALVDTYALPSRGHDVVSNSRNGTMVAFARRPGTFAAAIDTENKSSPTIFNCPFDRHFYGHGCFSADGRLLYATENNFEAGEGVIGIYDAAGAYKRIGEFSSGGVGPHDIQLLPDDRTLIVANGGIETHPDYPRAKLNLATMRPNLAVVDTDSGRVLDTGTLPPDMHKLSIRHLTTQTDGTVWFACQNQSDQMLPTPLVGSLDRSGVITLLTLPDEHWAKLRGYVGSIACMPTGETIVITSPRSGVALEIETKNQTVRKATFGLDICGVAMAAKRPFLTSGTGMAGQQKHELAFDNHVALLRT